MKLSAKECDQGTKTAIAALLLALLCWILSSCHSLPKAPCDKLKNAGPIISASAKSIKELVYVEARIACNLCEKERAPDACCDAAIDRVAHKYSETYQAVYDLSQVHDELIKVTFGAGICK